MEQPPQYQQVSQKDQYQQQAQARIGEASKRFGGLWKMLFFISAACVTAAGGISVASGRILDIFVGKMAKFVPRNGAFQAREQSYA